MKKLLRELFYVPKYGKVTEKTLFGRLSVYITLMVLCMAGMAFTAYAYFSASVLSGSNTIQAAHFDVEISVSEIIETSSVKTLGASVAVERDGANMYHAALTAGKEYLVTIHSIGTANTGFVLITAENTQYHTQQIFRDVSATLTFSLIPERDLVVAFMPHFGTSSRYEDFINEVEDPFYIIEGDEVDLKIPAESVVDQDGDPEETKPGDADETQEIEDPNVDATDPTQTSQGRYHVIKSGENLQAIANLYQVDMAELMKLNGITNASVIITGDRLLLPENAIVPPNTTESATSAPREPSETTMPTDNTDPTEA